MSDRYLLGASTNIFSTPLPDGTVYPNHSKSTDTRAIDFLQYFNLIRQKPWKECTFVDFGCNEGSASFIIGQSGSTVYGLEARNDAVIRATFLRDELGMTNVSFRNIDLAKDMGIGCVDAAYVAGILYHLIDPFSFIKTLCDKTESMIYLCTHCAAESDSLKDQSDYARSLSDLYKCNFDNENYDVANFIEASNINEDWGNWRRPPRSGHGNNSSIWLTSESLKKLLKKHGFNHFCRIGDNHQTLRYQFVAFREKKLSFIHPLPEIGSFDLASHRAYEKDVSFLHDECKDEIAIIGVEPYVDLIAHTAMGAGIKVSYIVDVNNKTHNVQALDIPQISVDQFFAKKPPYSILAIPEYGKVLEELMLRNFSKYVFTSFILVHLSNDSNQPLAFAENMYQDAQELKPASTVYAAADMSESDDAIEPEIVFKKECKPDTVSIVIPVAGHLKHLKKCVENIRKHTSDAHEIIFVDNGCRAGKLKWIRQAVKRKSNYRLVKTGKETCLGKCFNTGIEASSGEYIVLMCDNVIIANGWLNGMLRCINSADGTGIVGPMANAKASGTQCAAGSGHVKIDQLEKYAGAFLEKNRYRRVPSREVAGFCMLFRRRLVQNIGRFDEELEQGSESDDYCVRAALEGYKNLIAGDVFVLYCDLRPQGNKRSFKHKWSCIDLKSHDGQRMAVLNAITNAERLYQGEDVDKAIVTLIDGIQYRMEEEAIYHRLAEMLIGCDRFDEGLEVLKSIPEDKKDSARTFELTGYSKAGLELYDEAAQCADRALSLNGSSAPALNLMGVLTHRKDNSVSEDFFNKAIASDPGYGEAYTNLGVLAWETGREDDALELLEKGFILASTVEDSITAYRSAISETAEFERAEGIFREAKALYPLNRRIAFLLIDILIQQEKYESAIQEIREAMITFGISDGILSAAKVVLDRFDAQESKNKGEKPELSLCMIVKNEEDCLSRCLMSVIPVVDEIVIVDTGSTDRTKEIARTFGAKVYDFEWTDDFSEARNISLSKATGSWILVLDADETISPLDYERLSKIIKRDVDHPTAFMITTRNYVKSTHSVGWMCNDGQYAEEEDGTGWYPSEKVRLFTNDNGICFENAVHEIVEPSLRRRGIKIRECDISVHHYGQLDTDHYDSKIGVYYLLGKKELEEKGDEDIRTLTQLAIQAQGKLGKYEESVVLWEKVLKIDPGNTKALLNMGSTLLKLKKYEAARKSSKIVMEQDPGLKEAVIINTTCEVLLGDSGKTIPILENLLKKVPKYPLAIAILAAVYGMGHEREKGMKHIKYLMTMGFLCADYLHDLAERLIFVGKKDSAVSLLEFAVESGNGTREIRELLDGLLTGE